MLFHFNHRYSDGRSDDVIFTCSDHPHGVAAVAKARRMVRASMIGPVAIDVFYSSDAYDAPVDDRLVGTVVRDDFNLPTRFDRGPAYVAR